MSKKQIVLFTPLTPNGELPLNRIIRITHTTLLKHNLVRDGGENMAQLHVRLGSGWVPAATEHEHIHALAKICRSLHLHFNVDEDMMRLMETKKGHKYVKRYFIKLREILDETDLVVLAITGLPFNLIRNYVSSVFSVETITILGAQRSSDAIQVDVNHIHAKRIIGEFDDYQAIDFNS